MYAINRNQNLEKGKDRNEGNVYMIFHLKDDIGMGFTVY